MGGDSPVLLGSPDVIGTTITIAGVSVVRSTGSSSWAGRRR